MKGVFLIFSFLVLVTLTQVNASIAPSNPPIRPPDGEYEYIAYLLVPASVKPEDYYIKLLIPVVGSEKAAKDALVHSLSVTKGYFYAWLTPNQALTLQKQPGVIVVVHSRTYYPPAPGRK